MTTMQRTWWVWVLALACGCGDETGGTTTSSGSAGGDPSAGGGGGQGGGGQGGSGNAGGGGGSAIDCSAHPRGALGFSAGGEPHCYWLVETPDAQINANNACGAGAYLATAQSTAENDHLVSVADGASPVWIGLRCDANPGASCTANPAANYEWMNGETFGFAAWASGEPATPRGAALHDDGAWYGYDALNNVFAYICEAPQ